MPVADQMSDLEKAEDGPTAGIFRHPSHAGWEAVDVEVTTVKLRTLFFSEGFSDRRTVLYMKIRIYHYSMNNTYNTVNFSNNI